jgi:5-methylcytosine-specific restriction endonuclease McrA
MKNIFKRFMCKHEFIPVSYKMKWNTWRCLTYHRTKYKCMYCGAKKYTREI